MRSRTHALVRRQLTWLRRLPDAIVEPVGERDPVAVAASIVARL
jgi:tRNA A37 N6-isopentenylltransferase MiaA